ncbi:WD40-repeat-containing domain protein [Calycina marina]|uniref:WD40-repeat-containing domain protein n=1 Tax=Calycina marina TaxID=1763456 RepID=A0A9P7Z7E0_9HELO|nr:WD40-repeat-containing domain protein [Calycina marina]
MFSNNAPDLHTVRLINSAKYELIRTPTGNSQAQTNGRKASPKLIRNVSNRDVSDSGPIFPELMSSTAIDPLSHHILKRTHTENTIPQKLRNGGMSESPKPEPSVQASPEPGPPSRQKTSEIARSDSNLFKEKNSVFMHDIGLLRFCRGLLLLIFTSRKGVSFLSRFSIIGGKKKDMVADVADDESELGDQRTEGMNASVFSSSIGANGYIPQHKEPPRYIKVRAHNKKEREFDRMFLAQELAGSKHLITEQKVPGITSTEANKLSKSGKSSGAVWATEFSKDGKYLAAAGRDQAVRIWAVISTPEERQEHEHEEDTRSGGGERLSAPVFRSKPVREFLGHTGDILDLSWSKNNFLLSSSMDKTVRLWHMSRQECLCTFKHKDFVTSIAFHPKDDRFFLAGSLDSVLRLWSIPDKTVAFWNQLPDLITAVAFTPDGKTAMAGVLSGLCLFYETEGLKYHTQIHVRSSRGKNAKGSKITGIRTIVIPPDDPEGEMKVLITSNDSRVRMYNLRDKSLETKFRGHENTCSQINASFSDDAQYVICGSEDRKAYIWSTTQTDAENKNKRSIELFEAHSDIVTAAVMAPTKSRQLLSASGDPVYDLCNPPPVTLLSRDESNASSMPPSASNSDKRHSNHPDELPVKKPEESPAFLNRRMHYDGNIIITADYLGGIKVFRQDCAFHKRKQDNWETGSMFSKKMLGRSNSIMTRNSGSSRRNSISVNSIGGQDHIMSWRNYVTSNVSLDSSLKAGSLRGDRSASPANFNKGNSLNNLASTARQQQYSVAPLAPAISTSSPQPSIHRTPTSTSQPSTLGFSIHSASDCNSLKLDANAKSHKFWDVGSWVSPDHPKNEVGSLSNKEDRYASQLSSDKNGEGEALACQSCGEKDFRASKAAKKLVCTSCGKTPE